MSRPARQLALVLVLALAACSDDGGPAVSPDVPSATDDDTSATTDDAGPTADDATGTPPLDDDAGPTDDGAAGDEPPAPDDVLTPIEEVTDEPAGPIPVEPAGTWEATPTLVTVGEIAFAAPIGDRYVVQDGEGVVRVHDLELATVQTLAGDAGTVVAAAALADGTPLVATSSGLHVGLEGELVPSPVSELLADDPIAALALEDPAAPILWLATASGLHVFESDELLLIGAGDLPSASARIVWGLPVGGSSALWVAAGDAVYALVRSAAGLVVGALREDLPAAGLAADGDLLWVLLEDGDLQMREPDGSWAWLTLPSPVDAITGGAALWLVVDGALWFQADGDFGPVGGELDGTLHAVDPEGRGLVSDDEGLWLVAVGDAPLPPDVDPPTWSEDIEPLFVEYCDQCHGATGFAHPMFTRETWIEEFDLILTNVVTGNMPLPPNDPMTEVEIQVLEAWEAAGFPE